MHVLVFYLKILGRSEWIIFVVRRGSVRLSIGLRNGLVALATLTLSCPLKVLKVPASATDGLWSGSRTGAGKATVWRMILGTLVASSICRRLIPRLYLLRWATVLPLLAAGVVLTLRTGLRITVLPIRW